LRALQELWLFKARLTEEMCSTAMEAKEGHHLWDRLVLPVGKVKTQVEVESILINKKL
jgi:hypothetical protein